MAYVLCDPAKGTIVVTHGDGELAVPLSGDEPVLASVMRPPTQGPSGAVHAKVTPADASSVTVRGVLLVRNVMPPGLAAAGRATAFTAPYGCAVAHGAFHASQEDGVVWVTGDKAGFMMWSPPPVSRLTMTWKVAPADGVTVEVDNAMLTSDDTGLVRTYALPRRTEDDGIWSINIHAPANARAGGDAPSEARAGVSGLEIR